jgi:hypothetical protein
MKQALPGKLEKLITNKVNCELMLTYDTPALWQTGSKNLTGQKTLPTIWGTYMKLVTKYQISAIKIVPSPTIKDSILVSRNFLFYFI